jgi:hypothetical protein
MVLLPVPTSPAEAGALTSAISADKTSKPTFFIKHLPENISELKRPGEVYKLQFEQKL